ncbi:MAG TPA: M20 family metallopeptidase [Terriglobales bacterium]|nr:M20 family metallopeptidase [Terriglobales bacterium]
MHGTLVTKGGATGGLSDLLAYFRERQPQMTETLRKLVEMESPSNDKAAADRLAAHLAETFERLGGRTRLHRAEQFGDHVEAEFAGGAGKPVLLLGHYDTVWELGTLASMPFRIADGRAYGPGVYDMKAGITLMMYALEGLLETRGALPRPVRLLLVSDEEVGSESSRAITEGLARESAAVLVLEPATGPEGAVKTSRKGVGEYRVKITGIPVHAGIEPQKGASAIHELARQIARIEKFNDYERGLTVNVGVIGGGTRTNVVAAEAWAAVDVRVARMSDAPRIERKFRSLRPKDERCKLEVTGGVNRPPMERTEGVATLYELARELARGLGVDLKESATGGGSDGNFTAALGVPTLDGLGGLGDGAHARHEQVVLDALPWKAVLVAGLIASVKD